MNEARRQRVRRLVGGYFLVDLFFRALVVPTLTYIDPDLSIGLLVGTMTPVSIASWIAMGVCIWPVRRWERGEESRASILAAVRALDRFPLRAAALYSASWWVPFVISVLITGGFDRTLALLTATAVMAPVPITYSYATRLARILTPDLEAEVNRQALPLLAPDAALGHRMLVLGISISLAPCLYMASISEVTQRHADQVALPLALFGIAVFAVVCASMFASDFTAAHRALAKLNHTLEARVEERTASLATANDTIADEMRSRLAVEVELRQANKLEAVGRLAAGVAHEINSPVQYASDSVKFVKTAYEGLTALLAVHDRLVQAAARSSDPAIRALGEESVQALDDTDAVYLHAEMPLALDRALEGLTRVGTIVRAMNQFAYADGAEMTTVELNDAIQNTLAICNNEIKYVADLEITLGELPPVACFVGEVNQAVLNLVVNAAHAIGDQVKGTDRRGRIAISTRADSDAVVISIADTGGGIPAAIRDRIFEPFFTTKEVGRGTGQGLAIARAVAQKHRGALEFETAEGVGTTFHLRLPIAA